MIKLLNESGDETQKFTSLYLVEQINLFREQEKNKSKLRHSDFLRKIEAEFEEEIAERKISFRLISKELETGSTRTKVYELDYDQSLQILMSESRFVRKAVINVIKRQQAEIEALKPKLPNFEDPAEAAISWAKEYKEKQLALQKVENLNTVLDNLLDWVSVIKVSQHNKIKENVIDWRKVKEKNIELGYVIKKAESARFGYQNLYHINAFKACYPQYNYDFKNK